MRTKDKYSAEGLMAHRQRIQAGPNAQAIWRKAENAKVIAKITRRLKQGTPGERPAFTYTSGGLGSKGWNNWGFDLDAVMYRALKRSVTVVLDDHDDLNDAIRYGMAQPFEVLRPGDLGVIDDIVTYV